MITFLKITSSKIFDTLVLLALLLFAFFLTFRSGERGFFTLDQSIVFDGSYRVLSGQIPYKDFIMPVGPVVFWLQAIFFKILGISYFSYIFGAAYINSLVVLLSVIIIRLLFPSKKYLSYIAALLTAIWFYPPFGTPWVEQTAFFFSFLAITAILSARVFIKGKGILLLLAGSFAALSILSKQNAGLYILPLYFILLIAAYSFDFKIFFYSCITFIIGLAGSLFLFLWWVSAKSNLKVFSAYFFQIPALQGICRILDEGRDFWRIFFTGTCSYGALHQLPLGIRLIFTAALLIAGFAFIFYLYHHRKAKESGRNEILASLLCIYAIFFQYLFIHTTMNQAENSIPFIGIIFAASLGVSPRLKLFSGGLNRSISTIVVSFLVLYLALAGIKVSQDRRVQEFTNSEFPRYFALEKLKALKWGKPTRIWGLQIQEEDVTGLVSYLKAKNENFFIFPNFTILYGVLGVPSPQPLLWFHKGLTYHAIYEPELDNWIVRDLVKNKVRIIVIEENPLYNALNDFRQLDEFVAADFRETKKIGLFHIYEKI
ncbi:MAG: glycosyltransferase family 39 protein [Candidatus Omnitrophica bacterium]|nr:glycosyltransferase family 39 protein [Candidatus Omnitrophota bacterium]